MLRNVISVLQYFFDSEGVEIFRGKPTDMPFRFVTVDGVVEDITLNNIIDGVTPIDPESGDDLQIYE